jgi:hypothetical protein
MNLYDELDKILGTTDKKIGLIMDKATFHINSKIIQETLKKNRNICLVINKGGFSQFNICEFLINYTRRELNK